MGGFYWIASYPKSGNTWMRLMLASLIEGGAPLDFSKPVGFASAVAASIDMDLYLDVESSDLTPGEQAELRHDLALMSAREEPNPQFRKVHDCWGYTSSGRPLFPPEVTLGSVYILRDPRDVAVSWAHHAGITVDEAIVFMADGAARVSRGNKWKEQFEQYLGSWSHHVASWMAATPAPLIVSYERLSSDTATVLAEVASYLGVETSRNTIAKAVAATRFEHLQKVEKLHGFEIGQKKGHEFFRRGVASGWRDSLSVSQAERIVATHREMMERLSYI